MKILPPINVTERPCFTLTVIFSDFKISVQFLWVQSNSSDHISRVKFMFATHSIGQICFVLTFFCANYSGGIYAERLHFVGKFS